MHLDRQALTRAGQALFLPDRGLWVVPVRHHSPACAWALAALIRQVRPTHVLVEGPEDFDRHIDTLLAPATVPPVAIIALADTGEGGLRASGHYPFSAHSPEYVALQAGRAAGADLRFIDLASGEWPDPATLADPRPLQHDLPFTSGDYVEALCRETGCRDGHDLWDHLFEARLGTDDWQGFFADVGAYCTGLRHASPPDALTLRREARMAAHVARAQAAGGRIVVVVGGYHAPALCDPLAAVGDTPGVSVATATYLVRYGFAALDALGGYGAGLPLPGYYDRLWTQAQATGATPAWRDTAMALVAEHAACLRRDGHTMPLPSLVEGLRLAEGLASMRGRPGPMRQDLLEAVRTAMVKGQASDAALWTTRFATFLRGDRMGQVCRSAGVPPVLADAQARATALRFSITDSTPRDRRLEVRRKPAHRAASAFLHGMEILGTGFGRMTAGPDYDADIDPAHLHEHWTCCWSARIEARLIECAPLGDSLAAACAVRLMQDHARLAAEGRRDDLPLRCRLLERGLLAGLGAGLAPLADLLARDIDEAGDFAALARTLRRLVFMSRTSGPLRAPAVLDMPRLVQAAFNRAVWMIDGLAGLPADDLPAVIDALRIVAALVAGDAGAALDGGRLADALDRLAATEAPPLLLGAVMGLGVLAGRRDEGDLATALSGGFRGMDGGEGRLALLAGTLRAAPSILCRDGPLMETVDDILARIDEAAFMDLLPDLRHAFSTLTAAEVARLSAHVARRHAPPAAPGDGPDMAAAGRAVLADLRAEGLMDWFGADPGEPP